MLGIFLDLFLTPNLHEMCIITPSFTQNTQQWYNMIVTIGTLPPKQGHV